MARTFLAYAGSSVSTKQLIFIREWRYLTTDRLSAVYDQHSAVEELTCGVHTYSLAWGFTRLPTPLNSELASCFAIVYHLFIFGNPLLKHILS